MIRVGDTATVLVDGEAITGTVYNVRENGWPCIETLKGRVASGPEVGVYTIDATQFNPAEITLIEVWAEIVEPGPGDHVLRNAVQYPTSLSIDWANRITRKESNAI